MTEPAADEGDVSPFGFAGIVASAWRAYKANLTPMALLFAGVAVVSSLLPALFLLDVPPSAQLALYLFVQVVIPTTLASVAMAVISLFLWQRRTNDAATVRDAWSRAKPHLKEIVAAGLLAAMLGLLIALFLGPLSPLFLYLVFGPPILIQVVAIEGAPLQTAWQRTKALLRGRWAQSVMYLLTVALGVALISAVLINVAAGVATPLGDITRDVILNVVNVIALALLFPYLAAAGFATYRILSAETDAGEDAGSSAPL